MEYLAIVLAVFGGLIAAAFKFKDKLFGMKAAEKQMSVEEIKKDVEIKTEEVKKIEVEIEKIKEEIDVTVETSNKRTKEILKDGKKGNMENLVKEFDKW